MKILIIDDEPISNFIIKRLLQQISSDMTILDYTDPVKAMNDLPMIDPELILLDLNMPKLNGWEFLEKMKTQGYNNRVFILSSSTSSVETAQAEKYTNVVECVAKPISKEKLMLCTVSTTK